MTNKKGIAWIKTIILFILIALFSIFVIFVMNYIKNANKEKIKQNNNTIKMIENNQYNPMDNIYNYYLYGYKNSYFISNSSTPNPLEYETDSDVYYWEEGTAQFNNNTSGVYPWAFVNNKIDGKMDIGKDLYLMYQYIRDEGTYFNGQNGNKSFAIGYNCNIPINYFNFTFNYKFLLTTGNINIRIFIMTDVGSMYYTMPIAYNSTSYEFLSSNILTTLPQASKVLRFGFGISQSLSNTNAIYILPQSDGYQSQTNGINYCNTTNVFLTYYNSLTEIQKNQLCTISFEIADIPQEEINAYNEGKRDGINESLEQINQLNYDIYHLRLTINELNNTINNQTLIINSLQDQLNNQVNFKGFFFTMADVPVRTVSNVLGFEVFGVNLFQFFIGILTALGCVWLIKKFI